MSRAADLPDPPPARRLLLKGALAAGALAAATPAGPAARPKAAPYVNPLVRNRADQHITRHTDGFSYFTATAPEYDRIILRRSRTLNGLGAAAESVIRRAHPTGDMGAHIRAPEMHRVGGKWYIHFAAAPAEDVWAIRIRVTYSASATDANYLMDPASWAKSPVPVFTSNDTTKQYGPGHNCFTVAEDGRTDVLVCHARQYKEIDGDPLHDPNRHTRVQTLGWKADGTPDFGVPVADGAAGEGV
ncbi:hypothetical protein GCM10010294_32470 [Streptomyces griseoloalbus]|uniref:family 43 glycosylhydrolase n=1 Tax=Streptomyces griseoloalbus TaxID=67303 RepID=UPI001874CBCB|nr:hypothetical protein GCM10010294_32470 [Streptomyces griseoloalbus]